jgi:hypothetical protein
MSRNKREIEESKSRVDKLTEDKTKLENIMFTIVENTWTKAER